MSREEKAQLEAHRQLLVARTIIEDWILNSRTQTLSGNLLSQFLKGFCGDPPNPYLDITTHSNLWARNPLELTKGEAILIAIRTYDPDKGLFGKEKFEFGLLAMDIKKKDKNPLHDEITFQFISSEIASLMNARRPRHY